jgi:ABC-type glycerol-3-phosphate transport system permease component
MNESIRMTIIYTFLILFGLFMVVPFVWMISTSLMNQAEFNKHDSVFVPKEEYHVWKSSSGDQKIILVQIENKEAVIHTLDKDNRIVDEYKRVPASEVRKVKKVPSLHWDKFTRAFKKVPFATYFANTLFVSFVSLIRCLITSMLAAFAFGRMEFKGKDA